MDKIGVNPSIKITQPKGRLNVQETLSYQGTLSEMKEKMEEFLSIMDFRLDKQEESNWTLTRGTPMGSYHSFAFEKWHSELKLTFSSLQPNVSQCNLVCDITTSGQLWVGKLDHFLVIIELDALERSLQGEDSSKYRKKLDYCRRPVFICLGLMLLSLLPFNTLINRILPATQHNPLLYIAALCIFLEVVGFVFML